MNEQKTGGRDKGRFCQAGSDGKDHKIEEKQRQSKKKDIIIFIIGVVLIGFVAWIFSRF